MQQQDQVQIQMDRALYSMIESQGLYLFKSKFYYSMYSWTNSWSFSTNSLPIIYLFSRVQSVVVTDLTVKSLYRSRAIFMEQNLRFGMILGQIVIMKKKKNGGQL